MPPICSAPSVHSAHTPLYFACISTLLRHFYSVVWCGNILLASVQLLRMTGQKPATASVLALLLMCIFCSPYPMLCTHVTQSNVLHLCGTSAASIVIPCQKSAYLTRSLLQRAPLLLPCAGPTLDARSQSLCQPCKRREGNTTRDSVENWQHSDPFRMMKPALGTACARYCLR